MKNQFYPTKIIKIMLVIKIKIENNEEIKYDNLIKKSRGKIF